MAREEQDRVKVKIGGSNYEGWESVQVIHSVETLSGSFTIGGMFYDNLDLPAGLLCQVFINDTQIIKGYLDVDDSTFNEDGGNLLVIEGRDLTGDLVDCSAVHMPHELNNIDFKDLLERLIKPFGIKLRYKVGGSNKIKKVNIQDDTVHQVIAKESKKLGLLAFTDGKGNLIVDEPADTKAITPLVLGENLKSLQRRRDYTERYSQYLVRGQSPSTKESTIDQEIESEGIVTDGQISRYRPLLISGESSLTQAQAQRRAEWEAIVRKGKSTQYTALVQGWSQSNGVPWKINSTVEVFAPSRGISRKLLIKDINFQKDQGSGTLTRMVLVDEDSYRAKPEISKETEEKGRRKKK